MVQRIERRQATAERQTKFILFRGWNLIPSGIEEKRRSNKVAFEEKDYRKSFGKGLGTRKQRQQFEVDRGQKTLRVDLEESRDITRVVGT